jgi:hypothetical protein
VIIAVVGGALLATIQAWQRASSAAGACSSRRSARRSWHRHAHAAATVVFFPDGAAAILADGVAGALGRPSADAKVASGSASSHRRSSSSGGSRAMRSHARRRAARRDRLVPRRHRALGVVVMPLSGFWLVLVVGALMLRAVPPRPCNASERAL